MYGLYLICNLNFYIKFLHFQNYTNLVEKSELHTSQLSRKTDYLSASFLNGMIPCILII